MSPVLADGYYDGDGNWIEDTGSYGGGDPYDPWLMDSDGDGIFDGEESGGFNIERWVPSTMPYSYPFYDPDTGEETWETGETTYDNLVNEWVTTDPYNPDSDFDDLPDGWERISNYHPMDPSDGLSDLDSDGLSNGIEFGLGTFLWFDDSDGDDFGDGEEVLLLLSDPLNPDDPATEADPEAESTGGSEAQPVTAPGGSETSTGVTETSPETASTGDEETGSTTGGTGSGVAVPGELVGETEVPPPHPVIALAGYGNSLSPGQPEGGSPGAGYFETVASVDFSTTPEYAHATTIEEKQQLEYEMYSEIDPASVPWLNYEGGWTMVKYTTSSFSNAEQVWVPYGGGGNSPGRNFELWINEPQGDIIEVVEDQGMVMDRFANGTAYHGIPSPAGGSNGWTAMDRAFSSNARTLSASLSRGWNGIYPSGTPEATVWLRASGPAPEEITRTYLAVKTFIPEGGTEANASHTVLGNVTFTIPEGEMVSTSAVVTGGGWQVVATEEGMVQLRAEEENNGSSVVGLVPVEIDAVFGSEWEDRGRQRLNSKLQARAEYSTIEGDTMIFLIKGNKANGSNEKLWIVRTSRDEESLKEALSNSPYVVFEGHANLGLGPSFDSKPIRKIADFTNFGAEYAALNMEYINGGSYPNLTVEDSEIPSSPKNYMVVPAKINMERFPNHDGVGVGSGFFIQRYGFLWLKKFHFTRGSSNSKFLIAEAGSADLPTLGYKTFFFNSCNTARDFGEVFQHGRVFLSNVSCYPDGAATDEFVFGLIDDQAEADMLKDMNDTQIGMPDIDPSMPSYRVVVH